MKRQDILTFASELMSIGVNMGARRLSKRQADMKTYDTLNRFIDKLKKNPGYQEGPQGTGIIIK